MRLLTTKSVLLCSAGASAAFLALAALSGSTPLASWTSPAAAQSRVPFDPAEWHVKEQFTKCRIDEPVSHSYDAVVFGLHGLGSNGLGMGALFEYHGLYKDLDYVKWYWPWANPNPLGESSWFHIYSLDRPDPAQLAEFEEDEAGLFNSVERIRDLIRIEIEKGIHPKRIVLVGFSQGAIISLLTGLTSSVQLGGVLGFSGYLALRHKIDKLANPKTANLPVRWYGAQNDTVIEPLWARESAQYLDNVLGMPHVDYLEWPNTLHDVAPTSVPDANNWLKRILPPLKPT